MNIELPPPSAGAAAVIHMVSILADSSHAADASTRIALHQHKALNAEHISMATHVMTRALIVHSTLQSAARFIADNTGTTMPDAWRAVLDLALNMPVEFDTVEITA